MNVTWSGSLAIFIEWKYIMLLGTQITSITMSSSSGLFEFLSKTSEHIETVSNGSETWTVPQIIYLIIDIKRTFFVLDSAGNRAEIIVVSPRGFLKRAYIKTRPDGEISDNLLALPGGPFYKG